MSLGAVNGAPASRMRWQVGAFGPWWVDVDLTEPVELAGAVTVKLADVTGQGAIVSGGVAHGRAAYRIVGGKGGWGRPLPAKGYHNDAGVKASLVLADAARECGESLGVVPFALLGPHFARAGRTANSAGTGHELLNQLAPGAWYIDFPGVTQFGARAVTTYTGDGARTRTDPGAGVVEVTTDTIAALVPGVVVDGAAPATDVEYNLDASRLTARVYAKRGLSRQLDAIKRVYLGLFPEARYRGTFEYRVVTQDGERLNLQPVRVASGMPSLARVPVRPGVAGFRSDVKLGELVLVAFADADASRPNVIAHDAPDAPGWLPDLIEAGDATDFVAVKSALDAVQAAHDALAAAYDAHVHPTGVGPSGPWGGVTTPVGAQASSSLLKAKV